MNTEITDNVNARGQNWVCYDAECPLCVRWARRLRAALEKRAFILVPLQSPAVRDALRVSEAELLSEMRVITSEGTVFGGADAVIYLLRALYGPWVSVTFIPGVKSLLRVSYRWVAHNRYCRGGVCQMRATDGGCVPPERNQPQRENLQQSPPTSLLSNVAAAGLRHSRGPQLRGHQVTPRSDTDVLRADSHGRDARATKVGNLVDWLPLLILVPGAAVVGRQTPPWLYMWALAIALFAGTKWLSFRSCVVAADVRRRTKLQPAVRLVPSAATRKLAFLFAWIGMDARAWFDTTTAVEKPRMSEWLFSLCKILLGGTLVWIVVPRALTINPLLAGWTGMVGLVLLLHFGLFHLLALGWRAAGINATPLMRAPVLSRSVGEFWGNRWNTAFNDLAAKFLFHPLRRLVGVSGATMLVFFISGLVHDLIISVPARGGYGLPTLYFLLQGAAVLFEHTKVARRLGRGRGIRGWLFTVVVTAGPAFWLFHPTFVHNVILPFLQWIGAT